MPLVRDMEVSVGFYRDLVGFEVLGQPFLNEGTFKIVYTPDVAPSVPGWPD